MSRPTPTAYRTRNWRAYNEALKCRGSLTVWFDPSMSWEAKRVVRREGRVCDKALTPIPGARTGRQVMG